MKRTSPLSAPPPEQALPGLDAPASPTAVGPSGPDEPTGGRTRKWRRWMTWGLVVAGILAFVIILGSAIRLPYYSVSPGSALDMTQRVGIEGAPQYEPDGEIMLLFIRQRARVNVWEWLRASFDPDIDLYKEQEFVGDQSPEDVRIAVRRRHGRVADRREESSRSKPRATRSPWATGKSCWQSRRRARPTMCCSRATCCSPADGQQLDRAGRPRRDRSMPTTPAKRSTSTLLRDGVEQICRGRHRSRPTTAARSSGIRTAGNYDFPVEIERRHQLDRRSVGRPRDDAVDHRPADARAI